MVPLVLAGALVGRAATDDDGQEPDLARLTREADAIFVGTITAREDRCIPASEPGSAMSLGFVLVAVERTLRGDAAGEVWVYSYPNQAAEAEGEAGLQVGARYLFFVDHFGTFVGYAISGSGGGALPLAGPEEEALLAEVGEHLAEPPTATATVGSVLHQTAFAQVTRTASYATVVGTPIVCPAAPEATPATPSG